MAPGEETQSGGNRRCSDADAGLSVDVICELLAHPRRRIVLRRFADQPGSVADVDDLAEFLRRREGERAGDVSRGDVRVSLHHNHLPRLTDAGAISYDREARTVRYLGSDRIEAVVSALDER